MVTSAEESAVKQRADAREKAERILSEARQRAKNATAEAEKEARFEAEKILNAATLTWHKEKYPPFETILATSKKRLYSQFTQNF